MCAYINKRSWLVLSTVTLSVAVSVAVSGPGAGKVALLCRPLFNMQDFVINIQLKGFPTRDCPGGRGVGLLPGCQDVGGVAFAKCEGGAKSFP